MDYGLWFIGFGLFFLYGVFSGFVCTKHLKKNISVPPSTYVALVECSGVIIKIPE